MDPLKDGADGQDSPAGIAAAVAFLLLGLGLVPLARSPLAAALTKSKTGFFPVESYNRVLIEKGAKGWELP